MSLPEHEELVREVASIYYLLPGQSTPWVAPDDEAFSQWALKLKPRDDAVKEQITVKLHAAVRSLELSVC